MWTRTSGPDSNRPRLSTSDRVEPMILEAISWSLSMMSIRMKKFLWRESPSSGTARPEVETWALFSNAEPMFTATASTALQMYLICAWMLLKSPRDNGNVLERLWCDYGGTSAGGTSARTVSGASASAVSSFSSGWLTRRGCKVGIVRS